MLNHQYQYDQHKTNSIKYYRNYNSTIYFSILHPITVLLLLLVSIIIK